MESELHECLDELEETVFAISQEMARLLENPWQPDLAAQILKQRQEWQILLRRIFILSAASSEVPPLDIMQSLVAALEKDHRAMMELSEKILDANQLEGLLKEYALSWMELHERSMQLIEYYDQLD